jgi:hypothetical protein
MYALIFGVILKVQKIIPSPMLTGEGMIFSSIFFQKAIPGIHSLFSRYFRCHLVQQFLFRFPIINSTGCGLFLNQCLVVSAFSSAALLMEALNAGENPYD